MKTKTLKNQKPIDIDLHIKYACPNKDCGYHHWLSLKETQTKNFKVVCDCALVFKPKRIKTIKITYASSVSKTTKRKEVTKSSAIDNDDKSIPSYLLEKSIKILVGYGFDKDEAEKLLKDSYSKNPELDCGKLVKNTLVLFGG
jgi:hypothetical protein